MLILKLSKFIIITLYTLLIIYFLQGLLYPTGSLLSQTALLLYISICLFYFSKVLLNKKNNLFVISLAAIIIMVAVYYLLGKKVYFRFDGKTVNTFNYLKGVLFALATFFPFYYLSGKEKISEKSIKIFFIIYGTITIIRFFYSRSLLQTELSRDLVVNNAAYEVLSLFPFIFFLNNKKLLSNLLLLLLFVIILTSYKRGAILIATIVIIIHYFYYVKRKEEKINLWKPITLLFFVVIIGYTSYTIYLKNEFLQFRLLNLLEGGISGRDYIFASVFNHWLNSESIVNIFFGYGLWSSIDVAGNAAHNDWLELLSNCGLVGVSFYLILFYFLYRFIKTTKTPETKYILIIITTIWFLKSLYSMAYMDMDTAPLMLLLGYIFGNKEHNKFEQI